MENVYLSILEVIYGIYYLRIYKIQKISIVLRDIYERGRVQHVNVIYAACFKWILTNNCILHVCMHDLKLLTLF